MGLVKQSFGLRDDLAGRAGEEPVHDEKSIALCKTESIKRIFESKALRGNRLVV
jgi:hypothetical protein